MARWHFQFSLSLPHWLCDLCTRLLRSLWKHLISNACILLSMFAVMVHVSHAYKNMDMARERISLILELMAMFLSFQMTFSLVTVAVVWAILDSTSGLDPSSDTIAPRYLKLWTVSSFLFSMVMSVLMPLVLFVIKLRDTPHVNDNHNSVSVYQLLNPWDGPPRWPSGKASASRAEGPGFESRLRRDFFGVESYQ